jgi:hypothetical protein
LKLVIASPRYDVSRETERNRQLEAADRENHKRGRDIEVNPGRLILTSPDGTRWSVTVDDTGTLSAVPV